MKPSPIINNNKLSHNFTATIYFKINGITEPIKKIMKIKTNENHD